MLMNNNNNKLIIQFIIKYKTISPLFKKNLMKWIYWNKKIIFILLAIQHLAIRPWIARKQISVPQTDMEEVSSILINREMM